MNEIRKESFSIALDETDLKILRTLQKEGRISNSKLAEKINLSETPCWRRWKRLEEEGVIAQYQTVLDRRKLGYGVVAFVQISFQTHGVELTDEFETKMRDLDWIQMCHCITGNSDYIVQMISADLDEFLIHINTLRHIPGVSSVQSHLSVNEIKAGANLPIG
jgi:DNA-binding Lrp family transcriptional regulator